MRLSPVRWASKAPPASSRQTHASTKAQRWLSKPLQHSPHDKKRRDIISPDLCNEAIRLIQSTAGWPKPGTCDLIDINPGTSVWSKALHRALEPRRHVLVELEEEVYADALDPLLQQERSRYRHTSTLLNAFDLEQDLLSHKFREYHRNLAQADQDRVRYSRNHQLIITANLAARNVSSGLYKGPVSKLFVDAFQRSIAFNVGAVDFNKYGLVKLLAWIPEKDKYSIVPRCTGFRFRTSKTLEASCHIREIVSSFPNDGRTTVHTSWHGAALESIREIAKKQHRAGIIIPDHRRQLDPDPPSIFYPPIPENFEKLRSLRERPPLVDQYFELHEKVKKDHPRWFREYCKRGRTPKGTPSVKATESVPPDEVYDRKRLTLLRNRLSTTHNQYLKVDELACEFIALERELISLRRQHPDDKTPYLSRLKEFQESGAFARLEIRASSLFKDARHHLLKALDDYRALSHNPHILAWNNRDFEPLLCHPKTDFFPHQPMTLLEITPKEEFVQRINTSRRWICFDYVVHELDLGKNMTVQEAIERLAGSVDSGAYKDFLAQVPSLTDPLYGGHHDLRQVNARTLPTDTMIDIALAYENMPFRKDEEQMVSATMGRHNL